MPVALFETAMPTSERLLTHASHRVATGTRRLTHGVRAGYKMYPCFIFCLTVLGGI